MSHLAKILIIEDDPTSQVMMRGTLESIGYTTSIVSSGEEALRILENVDSPLIILLDWELPGIPGDEVCQTIRRKHCDKSHYIVFVTARTSAQDVMTALDKGASDFIRKPFNRSELRARVLVGQRALDMEKGLLDVEKQLTQHSKYDTLTGLLNRRAAMDILPRKIAATQKENDCLAVVVANLDNFKKINETFGYQTGDQILQMFANSVQMKIRTSDTIARWSGEEFLILIHISKNKNSQSSVLERLWGIGKSFSDHSRSVLGQDIATVRMGATFTDGLDKVEEILQSTNRSLDEAKNLGQNRLVWTSSPTNNKLSQISFSQDEYEFETEDSSN